MKYLTSLIIILSIIVGGESAYVLITKKYFNGNIGSKRSTIEMRLPLLKSKSLFVFKSNNEIQVTKVITKSIIHNNKKNKSGNVVLWKMQNNRYQKDVVNYVELMGENDSVKHVAWNVLPSKGGVSSVLTVASTKMHGAHSVRFSIASTIRSYANTFIGAIDMARPAWGVTSLSGCVKVADSLTLSKEYSSDMHISVMPSAQAGAGFHGWCYEADMHHAVTDAQTPDFVFIKNLHYISFSTAPSWRAVSTAFNDVYEGVASGRSELISKIANDIGLNNSSLSNNKKINLIKSWIKKNLKYSGANSLAIRPPGFDEVISQGSSDCKGLALVMVKLLRYIGIDARFVLLSSKAPFVLNRSAANMLLLDHVAVFIPSVCGFYDPTVGSGSQLQGHMVLDMSNGKIYTVPFPHDGRPHYRVKHRAKCMN